MSRENNLDRYLEDLFQNECTYKVEDGEEEFVKTGVQSLVKKLAEIILKRYYRDIDTGFIDLSKKTHTLEENSIHPSRCSKEDLLCVGSSNEGTRNRFPDEFDFIFPVYHFVPSGKFSRRQVETLLSTNVPQCLAPLYAISAVIVKELNELNKAPAEVFSFADGNLKIRFESANNPNTTKVIGPAFNMKFAYTNRKQNQRMISVDLVPAATVKGNFSYRCDTDLFRDFVKEVGRILIVREAFTFTEAEVHFMRDILSSNHKKVYRLLKFIIKGHDDHFCKVSQDEKEYSSYILKNFIIHHHFKGCVFTSESHCLLDILDEMTKHEDTSKIPMLTRQNIKGGDLITRKLILLPQLKELVKKLKVIRDTQEPYDFDKIKRNIPRSVTAEHDKEFGERLDREHDMQPPC